MAIDFSYYQMISGANRLSKESVLSEMQEEFNEVYDDYHITHYEAMINTNKAETVTVNGEREVKGLFYDKQLKEAVLNSNVKEFICETRALQCGDYVEHINKYDQEEKRTYLVRNIADKMRGYDSWFLVVCQQTLRFINNQGKIVEYQCHFSDTKTLLKEEAQLYLTTSYSMFTMFIQENEDTAQINENTRFIMKNRAYRVIGVDDLSQNGVLTLRIESDEKTVNDNLELGIADYYKKEIVEDEEEILPVLQIDGPGELYLSKEQSYIIHLKERSLPNLSWRVSRVNGEEIDYVELREVGNQAFIKCSNKKYVGSKILLTCNDGENSYSKEIVIKRWF